MKVTTKAYATRSTETLYRVLENTPKNPAKVVYLGGDRAAWERAYASIAHGYACAQVGEFDDEGRVIDATTTEYAFK